MAKSKLDNEDDINKTDSADGEEDTSEKKSFSKKKILFIVVPLLVIIVIAVSFFTIFNKNISNDPNKNYSIVHRPGVDGNPDSTVVFYDLPEINVQIKNKEGASETLKMKINVELEKEEDIKIIEGMMSRITDTIITHTIELTVSELKGIEGLYWFKEELLYRLNLVMAPTRISNLNFKNFEIQQNR